MNWGLSRFELQFVSYRDGDGWMMDEFPDFVFTSSWESLLRPTWLSNPGPLYYNRQTTESDA